MARIKSRPPGGLGIVAHTARPRPAPANASRSLSITSEQTQTQGQQLRQQQQQTELSSTTSESSTAAKVAASAAATEANISCPLLNLPSELLTSIVLTHLLPREAIFLSLTCRALYHGVLSSKNYFLWYKVGRFERTLPGFKAGWTVTTSAPTPASSSSTTILKGSSKKRAASEELSSTAPPSSKKAKARTSTRKGLQNAVKHYSPTEAVIDYKQVLVETMLGDADSGCQWCLARPMTRKVYQSWNMRLCEECFWFNVVSVFACKPLEIDISHLPIQDQSRQGGVLHGVWKPSVQRLVNRASSSLKNTPNPKGIIPPAPAHPTIPFPTVDSILSEHKSAKINAKAAAVSALNSARSAHITAIFDSIKSKYEQLYNEASLTSFKGSMFARVMEKIPPSALKPEWFAEVDEKGTLARFYPWDWKMYLAADPLAKILKKVKPGMAGPKLYEDAKWVDDWAQRLLLRMQQVLTFGTCEDRSGSPNAVTTRFEPHELPLKHLVVQVTALAKIFQIDRLRSSGADQTFAKARNRGLYGLECPWGSCYYGDLSTHPLNRTSKPTASSLEAFMAHIAGFHKEVLIVGDMDWLYGKPSRWWLRNLAKGGRGDQGKEEEELGWFNEEVQQEKWLKDWWGERWIDDQVVDCQDEAMGKAKGKSKAEDGRVIGHAETMRQWKEDGGFWGHSERLCRCHEPSETTRNQGVCVNQVSLWRCISSGCTHMTPQTSTPVGRETVAALM